MKGSLFLTSPCSIEEVLFFTGYTSKRYPGRITGSESCLKTAEKIKEELENTATRGP